MSSFDLSSLLRDVRNSLEYDIEKAILNFTEELLAVLEKKKLKNKDFAEKLGVSSSYITKILKGDYNFSLENMVKLSRALDCNLDLHLQTKGDYTHWVDIPSIKEEKKEFRPSEMKKFKMLTSYEKNRSNDETIATAVG